MLIFNVDGDGLVDTYYDSRQPIMVSVVTILVNDIRSVIHACILLTIIVGFCRIVDRVLLKIVGQLASSVEYKPRSHRNSKENLGEEGYFYDYNIRAK